MPNGFTQGDFSMRYTGNYFDQIYGRGYHLQPITFYEFLSKQESQFIYDESFFQIPGYVQSSSGLQSIEEVARQYVANFIADEFGHKLLGMQDYVRWAQLFKNKCDSITMSFWAQVNMHDLIMANDLEQDENNTTTSNTGGTTRLGGQTTTTDVNGKSTTSGETTSTQDIMNTQETDSSTRDAVATVMRAADQITNDLEYNWEDTADNIRETRSRAGDTTQHMDGGTTSQSTTDSTSHSESSQTMNNSQDNITNQGQMNSQYTNKQFMQEKGWAIDNAQRLMPLEWLKAQLRPMFYLIY